MEYAYEQEVVMAQPLEVSYGFVTGGDHLFLLDEVVEWGNLHLVAENVDSMDHWVTSADVTFDHKQDAADLFSHPPQTQCVDLCWV